MIFYKPTLSGTGKLLFESAEPNASNSTALVRARLLAPYVLPSIFLSFSFKHFNNFVQFTRFLSLPSQAHASHHFRV